MLLFGDMGMIKRPPLARAVQSMGLIPSALRSKAVGDPITKDGRTLDPDIQLLLKTIERVERLGSEDDSVEKRRKQMRFISIGGTPYDNSVDVAGISIPTDDGRIKARVYRPDSSQTDLPLVVFFHGGGFVVGDLDTHDAPCRALATEANVIVVAVDYRLGPEHRFPAGVSDAIAAVRYLSQNLERFDSSGPVAVMGDSAGGNLAAVVSNELAGTYDAPDLQVLIYPITDLGLGSQSVKDLADGFFLTKEKLEWFRAHYLTDTIWELTDPMVSPLRSPSLESKAPAIVITAGFDPLRDEGLAYASALSVAGNEVFYRCYDSFVHGFYNFHSVKCCRLEITRLHKMLGDVLHGRIAMDDLIASHGAPLAHPVDESPTIESFAIESEVPKAPKPIVELSDFADVTETGIDLTTTRNADNEDSSEPAGTASPVDKSATSQTNLLTKPQDVKVQRGGNQVRSDKKLSAELRYGHSRESSSNSDESGSDSTSAKVTRRSDKPTLKRTAKPSDKLNRKAD